ncbi:MAG TPA: hypothetical protein VKF14_15975 [Candidatus Dormibacteraeota bacterium]|nr:hypothetical protein [Candidatus Dormibacteraeota bacterium]
MVVTVDGGVLSLPVVEAGDALVLVHIGLTDHRSWQLVRSGLSASSQVIAHDRRGHSGSRSASDGPQCRHEDDVGGDHRRIRSARRTWPRARTAAQSASARRRDVRSWFEALVVRWWTHRLALVDLESAHPLPPAPKSQGDPRFCDQAGMARARHPLPSNAFCLRAVALDAHAGWEVKSYGHRQPLRRRWRSELK